MIPDTIFFVRRLTEAVDALWPPLDLSDVSVALVMPCNKSQATSRNSQFAR